jgi:hypothetical protein
VLEKNHGSNLAVRRSLVESLPVPTIKEIHRTIRSTGRVLDQGGTQRTESSKFPLSHNTRHTDLLVREHLYRRHALPIRCPRCCAEFSNDVELINHSRQRNACDLTILDLVEGFDKSQEKKMRSRKKTSAITETEKWVEIYKILFPDDEEDLMPSPCQYTPLQNMTGSRN